MLKRISFTLVAMCMFFSNVSSVHSQNKIPKTTIEILKDAGFLPQLKNEAGVINLAEIGVTAIPSQIVSEIQSTPIRDVFDVTGDKTLTGKIIRVKRLTFNPKSKLTWQLGDEAGAGNYVVIAAETLTINLPAVIGDAAKLSILPPIQPGSLDGGDGGPGPTGWVSGHDDGRNAGHGQPGATGGSGRHYDFPTIYFAFQSVTINSGNPVAPQGLKVEARGIKGGTGGKGGPGGRGGYGSRGTPGDRTCVFGICACSAGPGRGGDGGNGGPGGRGGDSGRGGNGGIVMFVGPLTQVASLDRIGTIAPRGEDGRPGDGGLPGDGGGEGGGGSKPWECTDGGGSGRHGDPANPPSLGPGAQRTGGVDGAVFFGQRNNADLF